MISVASAVVEAFDALPMRIQHMSTISVIGSGGMATTIASVAARAGHAPQKGQTMLVFISGGTGQVGSYVVSDLIAAGHEVVALNGSDASRASLRSGRRRRAFRGRQTLHHAP
ncbi:NAD-dependent epimerase/dehydratase family protein [Pseudomonas sp. NPDC087358]|uniref:NAD-dependent epimerase/dehydratase family protein n=1 Tax=Pseudomonas sp. NPDC087358 TaxID=3364439 RepID=UPI00384F0171